MEKKCYWNCYDFFNINNVVLTSLLKRNKNSHVYVSYLLQFLRKVAIAMHNFIHHIFQFKWHLKTDIVPLTSTTTQYYYNNWGIDHRDINKKKLRLLLRISVTYWFCWWSLGESSQLNGTKKGDNYAFFSLSLSVVNYYQCTEALLALQTYCLAITHVNIRVPCALSR